MQYTKFSKCKTLVGNIVMIQHAFVKFVRLFHRQSFMLCGSRLYGVHIMPHNAGRGHTQTHTHMHAYRWSAQDQFKKPGARRPVHAWFKRKMFAVLPLTRMNKTFFIYIGICKIIRKTFAVYRKSTKTTKHFSSSTFVVFDIYIANIIATCLAIRLY